MRTAKEMDDEAEKPTDLPQAGAFSRLSQSVTRMRRQSHTVIKGKNLDSGMQKIAKSVCRVVGGLLAINHP
jgi:hypothetical protein